MNEPHREADRLSKEADDLKRIVARFQESPDELEVKIALSQAKRVRRESTSLVRVLASLLDTLRDAHAGSRPD